MDPRQSSLFRQQAFVDGSWIDAESGAVFAVRDPATGELLGHAPDMGASETRRAIAAAERALPLWRGRTAKERAQIMRRWFELILAEQETLAQIITAEQGKPLVEARGEILYGASFIDWFAEEGRRVYGDVLPIIGSDRRLLTFKQPVGVVAAITPWNFPSAMFARKVGAALGAGCAMVLKPAEQTPFSALALVELAQRAGVPDGVVNVVTALDPTSIGLEFALDRGRQDPSAPGGGKRAEMLDGARRQRAVDRVRGRRFRPRDQGRARHQIQKLRPDLRLRQPHIGA